MFKIATGCLNFVDIEQSKDKNNWFFLLVKIFHFDIFHQNKVSGAVEPGAQGAQLRTQYLAKLQFS